MDNYTTNCIHYQVCQRSGCHNKCQCFEEKHKGEWVECTKSGMPLTEYGRMTGEKWYGFKCSRCNYIYKGNALVESPFCQKCGANMERSGKNDT